MSKFEKIDLGVKEAYDELFMNNQERAENRLPKIYDVPLSQIDDFPDHPYKVRDDEDMQNLVESVRKIGVITPVTLREKEDGRYELVSGHRRKRACELAGYDTIKAEIKDLTKDEATILMVDSNFQRSTILPSEKGFAYKMKLDAMKRQVGRPSKNNSDPLGPNLIGIRSNLELAEASGESTTQIKRYIRLTNLIPELLDMVDEGKIALRPAVEISFFTEDEQDTLYEKILVDDATPSLAQAIKMRNFSKEGKLTDEVIETIMDEVKPNQKEKISIKAETLKKYIPSGFTIRQQEEYVIKALDFYKRYMDRQREQER